MSLLSRHIRTLWDSTTFTSWLNQGANSVRLVVLLPLILHEFDKTEQAAWLLFSSVLFFTTILSNQTSLTFSRMVALAMGGADDLSPISGIGKQTQTKGSNWPLIERVYRTMHSLNLGLGLITLLISTGIGLLSLSPMLEGYQRRDEVLGALLVFVFTAALSDAFRRYSVALRGLNKMALVNRWEALFSVLAPSCGALAILMGAGIIELALVMQGFELLRVLRMWYLLTRVVEPRFRHMGKAVLDREIIRWAWTPTWKGLTQGLCNRGSSKICMIFLARECTPEQLVPFLLALRLLEVLESVASAPLTSKTPALGRLLAEGKADALRRMIVRTLRLSSFIEVSGILAIGAGASYALELVHAKISFMDTGSYLLLATTFFCVSLIRQTLMISIIGNNVVAVSQFAIALAVSVGAAAIFIPMEPILGTILSMYLPVILIVNITPLRHGTHLLGVKTWTFAKATFTLPVMILVSGSLILLAMCVPTTHP